MIPLIAAGVGALGSIAGNIIQNNAVNKARQKQDAYYSQMQQENEDWYNRRYNEDGTQRADAVRSITLAKDYLRKANKSAEGKAAVMGSADEAVAQQKAANNATLADAVSAINASAEARKDNIENQYRSQKQSLAQQQMQSNLNLDLQNAQNIANTTSNISSLASSMISAYGGDSLLDKLKNAESTTTTTAAAGATSLSKPIITNYNLAKNLGEVKSLGGLIS